MTKKFKSPSRLTFIPSIITAGTGTYTRFSAARAICTICAKANGATHIRYDCTHWHAKCDVCGEETAVCDVSDWNWPAGKQPASWSLFGRD